MEKKIKANRKSAANMHSKQNTHNNLSKEQIKSNVSVSCAHTSSTYEPFLAQKKENSSNENAQQTFFE